jgi:hypothetical protein
LGLCNCGINPMVYCFCSKKYRHGFKCLMMCKPYFYPTRYFTYHSGKIPTAELSSYRSEERISNQERVYTQAKFMLVHYSDGNMTVSFRKEETRQTSIWWLSFRGTDSRDYLWRNIFVVWHASISLFTF